MDTVPSSAMAAADFREAMRFADMRVIMDVLSADLGEPEESAPIYPPWVLKCGHKVCRARFPKAYTVTNGDCKIAYLAGLSLGMMEAGQANLQQVGSKVGLTAGQILRGEDGATPAASFFPSSVGFPIPALGENVISDEARNDISEFVAKSDFEGKTLFYQGMADAFGMFSGKDHSTPTTLRYSTMLVYWRLVETMDSMEQLHEFLLEAHGPNIVGSDIKGTRQLCGRVGKRFAAPGHPKKPQA